MYDYAAESFRFHPVSFDMDRGDAWLRELGPGTLATPNERQQKQVFFLRHEKGEKHQSAVKSRGYFLSSAAIICGRYGTKKQKHENPASNRKVKFGERKNKKSDFVL